MPYLRGEFDADSSVAQFILPDRVPLWVEKRHGESQPLGIDRKHFRHCPGRDLPGKAQVIGLIAVTLDRCKPVCRHLQPGKRSLDANRAAAKVYPADIG